MSKKVINLKAVIDFFCTNEIKNTEETIHCANKLVSEYNKNRKDGDTVVLCNEVNIEIWLGVKEYVKRNISAYETQIF